jgi:hypothetical protein
MMGLEAWKRGSMELWNIETLEQNLEFGIWNLEFGIKIPALSRPNRQVNRFPVLFPSL